MGNTQTKNNALQQYQILQQADPLKKILRRKQDSTPCLLIYLPIYGQQKYKLIERIKVRLGNDKPLLVTPLISWQRRDQANLCGNRQSIELIFEKTSPTLQSIFRDRRQKNISFSSSEIFYVLKNIALALKNLQKIQQQHGKVNLNNITVHNNVLLLDNLILEKRVGFQHKKNQIEGYPSPQKLRSLYDSVSNYEELRGDLFSLGMVGLQLYFQQFDIKSLYMISDPRYSNYRLNLQKLYQLCSQVRQSQLRQALSILLSLNSKDRLNIYAFLKTVIIDARQVKLFELPTANELYTPIQSAVEKSGQMVHSHINVVNTPISRQEHHASTVQSSLAFQKPGSQIRSMHVPPVNFCPSVMQNQPTIIHNQVPITQSQQPLQHSAFRTQSHNFGNAPSTFQPLRFILQDNIQTSRFTNVNHSALKSVAPVTFPTIQTGSPMIFPFSQVLASVQKPKAQNQSSLNTQVKQLHFVENNVSVPKQQDRQQKKLDALLQNLQKDQVIHSTDKKDNLTMTVRTESIYQQETRPLAQQLFKTIIAQTTQNKETIISPAKESLQIDINPIPISNTHHSDSYKIDQQGHKELPLTPKFSQLQSAQTTEQNITEPATINQQNKENQTPNPEDKIQFVIEEYGIDTRYEGGKLNGMRHGRGKFFYKEGSYYDGEWKNNKMHGIGVLYYPNGSIAYEGEWKDDQFDGKGIVYNDQQVKLQGTFDFTDFNKLDEQWIKYQGDLKNDAKQGLGRLYLTNGQIYQGQFSKDTVHGVGMFKSGKSEKKGLWQNGKLKKLI